MGMGLAANEKPVMRKTLKFGALVAVIALVAMATTFWWKLKQKQAEMDQIRDEIVTSENLEGLSDDCVKVLQQMEVEGVTKLSDADAMWASLPRSVMKLKPKRIYLSKGTESIVLQFGEGHANVLFLSCSNQRVMILSGRNVEEGTKVILPRGL